MRFIRHLGASTDGTSPIVLASIVLASTVAVALVPVWVLRDWNATVGSKAFVSTPQFLIWLLILCVQAAIWVVAALYVVVTLTRRGSDLRRRNALPAATIATILASILALVLVMVLFSFGGRLAPGDLAKQFQQAAPIPVGEEWPLADHEAKMRPLVGTGLLIGLLAIAAMWLTTAAFHHLARHAGAQAFWINRFVALRGELTTLLAVAATLIGLATLASGALREAVIAATADPVYRDEAVSCLGARVASDEPPEGQTPASVRLRFDELSAAYPECNRLRFDRSYVIAYGLLFTVILGIAFAPSFIAMRRAGERLRDRTYPLRNPRDPTFFEVVEMRSSLDNLLQTNLSATTTFKAGAAILTPFLVSLVSTVLPT